MLPYYHFNNQVSTVNDTIVKDITKEGSRIYLVRSNDFEIIKLRRIEKFNYWLVDDDSLPVLHFDRSVFRDNIIHSGRLYFQPQYVENMEWVKKSEDFILWADKIIKTVRRKLNKYTYQMGSYNYTEYLGENALEWLEKTKAEVGGGGHQLIPTLTTTNE
ncbi:MAG: hypothetical protein OQK29_03480 [Ignavibacteriaceae bacterium]|nr:hypothetical protein [Ignavibacteriaceae bacterium]